jgi:hypothetical protein
MSTKILLVHFIYVLAGQYLDDNMYIFKCLPYVYFIVLTLCMFNNRAVCMPRLTG